MSFEVVTDSSDSPKGFAVVTVSSDSPKISK